ncbi:hypothetical protein CJF32_00009202 [Rutstroemia sp. NJR-2017a WRK4]|nr:hypothetical protein CJF32_00009202 [Rutstroemia sp. NJR-2017a WRK4]
MGEFSSRRQSPAFLRCFNDARTSKKLTRTANKARKMAAKAIRNMQVPAYCPVEVGVQVIEKRGVLVEVKNVIAIVSIDINVVADEDIDKELSVELAMDIADVVVVGDPDVDIVMPDIDMSFILVVKILWGVKILLWYL